MELHEANLNIWYHLPKEIREKLPAVYEQLPGWIGFIDDVPCWFGVENEGDEDTRFIWASAEPGGLHFAGRMEAAEWAVWLENLKQVASRELGFAVGEPEEGYT